MKLNLSENETVCLRPDMFDYPRLMMEYRGNKIEMKDSSLRGDFSAFLVSDQRLRIKKN